MNGMQDWERQNVRQAAATLRMAVQSGSPPDTAIVNLKAICNAMGDWPNMNSMGVEQATLYTLALLIEKS